MLESRLFRDAFLSCWARHGGHMSHFQPAASTLRHPGLLHATMLGVVFGAGRFRSLTTRRMARLEHR